MTRTLGLGLTQGENLKPERLHPERCLNLAVTPEMTAGLPMAQVVEIITLELPQITPIPDVQATILGVFNWRQQVLWLVDLPAFLGLTPLATQKRHCQSLDVVLVRAHQLGEDIKYGLAILAAAGIQGLESRQQPPAPDLTDSQTTNDATMVLDTRMSDVQMLDAQKIAEQIIAEQIIAEQIIAARTQRVDG